MIRIIVGTAGHIDHGKTRLVEALTGIDCDRWKEEKERGITIDLGFAHLAAEDVQMGFIDVPGHEKFLDNALAGLGGIRTVLLVVAADEGVKPQTREHLDICTLLEIPSAVVALTKTDLASADLVELARLEIEELLAATPYAGAPVLAVSSQTGEGIEELRACLLDVARSFAAAPDPELPARLPVDRAFHLKGRGLVVTGTLLSGVVRPGDVLQALPGNGQVRVRGLQVHGEERKEAWAGERTALLLTGAELADLARGTQLVAPGSLVPTRSLAVRLRLLAGAPEPLTGSREVRVHLYSGEVVGRLRPLGAASLEPGATGAVEIRLARPVACVRGDRLILRRPSPALTLGGGLILDPAWHPRRGRSLHAALEAVSGDLRSSLRYWVREAGEGGATAQELSFRIAAPPARLSGELEALAAEGRLLAVPGGSGRPDVWIAPDTYRRVSQRARRLLQDYFAEQRLAQGMPKAEAVERILSPRGRKLAATYLDWLAAEGVLVLEGERVNLPGRSAELSGEESSLARSILERFEAAGLEAPSAGDLCAALGAKRQIFDGVIRYLLERRRLLRLPGGLLVAAATLDRVRSELLATGWERFDVGAFKERFEITRKWAIPLLEHLDSIGVTRRLGNERQVVRPAGGGSGASA